MRILYFVLCYNVNKRVHPNNPRYIFEYNIKHMYMFYEFLYLFYFVCVCACSQAAAGLDLKENLAAGATWPYPSVYHPYDAAFGYPFNG